MSMYAMKKSMLLYTSCQKARIAVLFAVAGRFEGLGGIAAAIVEDSACAEIYVNTVASNVVFR